MKKTKETLECPIKDIVKCNKGLVDGGDGQTTCTDACDEGCCVNKYGNDACVGFPGSVSKDGKSCIEYKACGNANIGTVCDGCHRDYTILVSELVVVMATSIQSCIHAMQKMHACLPHLLGAASIQSCIPATQKMHAV